MNYSYYHSNVGMSISFQIYFDCIETKQDYYNLFEGLRIYLFFLLQNIYLYNIYNGNKLLYIYLYNKYIYITKVKVTMIVRLHGGATT